MIRKERSDRIHHIAKMSIQIPKELVVFAKDKERRENFNINYY